jgi:hypothetical protein
MVYHIAGGNRPPGSRENPLEAIDGDFTKVRPLDETQDGGIRIRASNALSCGRRVDGTHMPTRLKRRGPVDQPILDVDMGYGGSLLVSDRFKDIVERFEPDTHQFFPMTIEQRGKLLGRVSLFVIGNRLDTIHRDPNEPDARGPDGGERRVFDRQKIGDHHAWYEQFAVGRYASDALFEALQAANLSGLGYTHFEHVPISSSKV